jgi:cyclopropane fatty-acyl-phospholipid synthase-like methyltransferase
MNTWVRYWDAQNRIFTNERQKLTYYDAMLAGVQPYLPGLSGTVLDWGCGDALAAGRIADHAGTVLLYDTTASTRYRLQARYRTHPRIRILWDLSLDQVATESVDLIVANSVIQSLSTKDFDHTLRLFYLLLRPGGSVLLVDIIGAGAGTLHHAATFLRFAWSCGFLFPAIRALVKTFVPTYRKLQRREVRLLTYESAQMLDLLRSRGFIAEKLSRNVVVSDLRSSYHARKPCWGY